MFSEFIDGLLNFQFLAERPYNGFSYWNCRGAVGCFIILRGMSLMGDAISHVVLPGVAISFILGINFFIGAIVFGLLASTIITYIKAIPLLRVTQQSVLPFQAF